jgi:NAD(P)-dependent dehydrogenase (short-subunit alcohol dehydrogenase family)
MLLKDKVALVTGAGSGIGRAIAKAYAARGAKVLVTDLNVDNAAKVASEIKTAGGTADSAHLDVTNREQQLEAVAKAEKAFGKLDIACNNAGITVPAVRVGELSHEQWAKVMRVDLDGVFYGVKAQIPAMLRAGGGTIVTISSIAGKRGLWGMAPYAAAKHAVIGLMQTIAWEYGNERIRALAVGPAYIKTGLEENIPAEIRKQLPGMHALGRMGEPEEVANTVAFLSSDEASFITGSYVAVDGGYLAR